MRLVVGPPGGQGPDVVGAHRDAVLGAQQVLQQDLQAVGQVLVAGDRVHAEDLVAGVPHHEIVASIETVQTH